MGKKPENGATAVALKSIDQLRAASYNPRKISGPAFAGLKASLDAFGDISGIVWNRRTGNLVAGHQRLAGLREVHGDGLKIVGGKTPRLALQDGSFFSVRVVDWDDATERAANIAANNPHIAGDFTDDLGPLLDVIRGEDAALFEEINLDPLFAELKPKSSPVDPDDVPEPPKKAKVKTGEIWELGRHRLLCGDATSEADVGRLLDGAVPFLMVTDPPWGVDYDPKWREKAARNGFIKFVPTRKEGMVNDDRADWAEAWAFFSGAVSYVWHSDRHFSIVAASLTSCGFEIRNQIIWSKASFAISRGHYHSQHESCWYAVRKGATAKWTGDHSQTTLWEISLTQDPTDKTHGTQKPVECMARPIRNHGGPSDDVYDPFLGSGTTIIAAEQLGRRCFAMEIDPKYCDVSIKRWEAFTGRKAKRIEKGVAAK